MDLRQVRYAIAIARAGSLRRASAVLHIAQPTLSEQLRALEKEIGVELFSRSSAGVRLTEAGEAFLAQATIAVNAFEHAVSAARDTGALLRLGVADGLGDLLAALLTAAHNTRLRVAPMGTAEQLVSIAEGTLQAGLGYSPGSLPRGVARTIVQRSRVHALVPRDHHLSGPVSLTALAKEPLVLPESDAVAGARRFLAAFGRHGLQPRLAPAAATHDLAIAQVEAGAGYTLSVRKECPVPESLTFLEIAEELPPIDVVFLWNRQPEVHDLVSAARQLARNG
ncbi:LysR family transcriptional regulator [Nonomuraea sp. NPDC050556]|uniref:LysR family transcriptional regulator n=1 Tax=Nonomuraea sp. NPDC050556 TaxID=3364369 RepID=UPI0037A96728